VVIIRTLLAVIPTLFGMLLVVPIVVLGLPFWSMAFLIRACLYVFAPHPVPWNKIIEFDPTIGWKPKGNLDAHCSFAAGIFHVKTDSQGWRGKVSIYESELVVFGDSCAFGYGVNDDKAFFSVLNSKLRIRAIGSPGYNMVQELILMRQCSSQLRGKLVVWFICLGNDLIDNLLPHLHGYGYRMPFVREVNGTGNWQIVTSHLSPAKWPSNSDSFSRKKEKWEATFGTTRLSRRSYSACEFLISQANETCERSGGRLVVMTIPVLGQLSPSDWEHMLSPVGDPKSFNPHLPDRKIMEICSRVAVPFAAGKEYLHVRDLIPCDGHWNERGHQQIAQVLQMLYRDYMMEVGRTGSEGDRTKMA